MPKDLEIVECLLLGGAIPSEEVIWKLNRDMINAYMNFLNSRIFRKVAKAVSKSQLERFR